MASIQGIYLALFGRPADPAGLAYWTAQSKNGADLSKVIDTMTKLPEATARFAGQTDTALVTSIYQALFDRAPDAAGLAFFTQQLASGKQTIGSLAINILDGATGTDLTLIGNRVKAADVFTASLDTPAEIAAYNGTTAADFGRSFVKTVTADPATIPTSTQVQTSINTGLPGASGGQAPGEGQTPGAGGGGDTTPPPPADTYKVNAAVTPKNGSNNLYVGSGNPADGFAVTTDVATGIELGLSVRHRYGNVEKNGISGSSNAVRFQNIGTEDLSVGYSVYKNGGLDTANHTYKLFFDNNADTTTKGDGLIFILQQDQSKTSGYKWTLDLDKNGIVNDSDKVSGQFVSIIDDAKSPAGDAVQNIQPLRAFINSNTNATATTLDKKGLYEVTLSAFSKAGALEAESTVQVVVNNDIRRTVDAKTFGFSEDHLWVGQGNSTAHFSTATINPTGQQINLAISGRQSGAPTPTVGTLSDKDGLVHFKADAGATDERFAYSISTQTNKLTDYKFLMKIDTDAGLGTNYVVYEMTSDPSQKKDNLNYADSKVSWKKISDGTGFDKISDDGGDSTGSITQNIENISWFDANPQNGTLAAGRYDVILEAWSKDGVTLLGMNHVVFDAVA